MEASRRYKAWHWALAGGRGGRVKALAIGGGREGQSSSPGHRGGCLTALSPKSALTAKGGGKGAGVPPVCKHRKAWARY